MEGDEMHNTVKLSMRRWAAQLALTTGLTLLLVAALLWAGPGPSPARADPGTLYVSGATGDDTGDCRDPAAPCQTIGHAISQAVDGDTILIAGGQYAENLFIGAGLTLRGTFAVAGTQWTPDGDETTIDGSGQQAPVITIADMGDQPVTLESLTIAGGEGECSGGVCAGNTPLVIRNCTIRDNTATGAGGALAGGNPTTIEDSYILNNHLQSDLGPGQTGGAGGLRTGEGPLYVINTLLAGNTGDAAIHVNNDLTLMNVTLADNVGDIIFNPAPEGTLAITNSIVYFNTNQHLGDCPSGSECITYSDVEGWTGGGTGNIDADPLFVDAASGDYHLSVWSPCRDKGTPTGAPTGDIEGTPRDAVPDMGAYEWTGFSIFLPVMLRSFGT
jgi:hypothetical protein